MGKLELRRRMTAADDPITDPRALELFGCAVHDLENRGVRLRLEPRPVRVQPFLQVQSLSQGHRHLHPSSMPKMGRGIPLGFVKTSTVRQAPRIEVGWNSEACSAVCSNREVT